jgi:hypothetical protein
MRNSGGKASWERSVLSAGLRWFSRLAIARAPGTSTHKEDASFLISLLGLQDSAAVLELVGQYYPAAYSREDTILRSGGM